MKLTATLTLALTACTINAAALQARHYLFPAISGTADWSSVRTTANHYSNGPVTDVSSSDIRCYELTPGAGAATTQSVAAGGSVSFKITPNIFHQGPLQFYMAKVPSGKTAATWDGSGTVRFKIYAEKANVANGALTWGSMNAATASVTIPKATPSGEYLLRVEHIALHTASAINGAQIYLSCAQIKVTGGGNGSPAPLVAFPGAYTAGEKGLQVNIYSGQISYTPPGPAVWSG